VPGVDAFSELGFEVGSSKIFSKDPDSLHFSTGLVAPIILADCPGAYSRRSVMFTTAQFMNVSCSLFVQDQAKSVFPSG
jgi:hypothetical protein